MLWAVAEALSGRLMGSSGRVGEAVHSALGAGSKAGGGEGLTGVAPAAAVVVGLVVVAGVVGTTVLSAAGGRPARGRGQGHRLFVMAADVRGR